MNDIGGPLEGPRQNVTADIEGSQYLAGPAMQTRAVPDFEEGGFDLRAIWLVLRARWYWILAAGALGLGIALVQSLMAIPLYRATASIELNPPSVPILAGSGQGDDLVVSSNGSDWTFLTTQYGLLRSRDLARRVVEDLNLAAVPTEAGSTQSLQDRLDSKASELAGNLTVNPLPDSRLVELSYSSSDPQEAARIVNGYIDAFLNSGIDRRYEATATAREFLADRLETVREQLNSSEQALVQYARANNIIMPGTTGSDDGGGTTSVSLTATSLTSLNEALASAQQRRITAEQRYRQGGSISEARTSTASLRAEKAALEAEYREKSTYLQDEFPEMARLRMRITALDDAMREESSGATNSLQAEYQAALAEENELRTRVRQLSGSMLDEQESSVDLNVIRREVDTNSALYQALLDRYNEIGIVEGVGTPQAAALDRAMVPGGPYTPDVPGNLLMGLILGLGLGVALAFIYEFITDTIKTIEDVREKLRQPLLGAIPMKGRKDDLAEQLSDPMSPISEAYGSLVITTQFTTNQGFPKVLTISSARAAEGKSTTSLILAKRMAQLGKRVLLIDADLRKPSFIIDEAADCGLSQFLTGNGSLPDHLLATGSEGLYLMPSGPTPPNPSLLLSSNGMDAMLDQLKRRFDHIILDGPPVLGFSDSAQLGQKSDGVMLIVESGKTRRRAALDAISQLQASGCRILGVTLTKHSAAVAGYGHNYRYYQKSRELPRTHELTAQLLKGDGGR